MVKSRSAPCKTGDETMDYEDMATLQEATLACDAILRGSNPFYSDHLQGISNKNMAPAASVITGEVVVNVKGRHGGVALSAGVITVLCISAIAVLLIFLCVSEILNSLSGSRRRHNISIFNRQDVHDDHPRAAPVGHVGIAGLNPSEVVHSNGSLEVAGSIAGSNDAGSKQGLAHWVIKALPVIKYKKQELQLHPGLIISTNSASSVELIGGRDVHRNSGVMIARAELDHDIEFALPAQAICNETASDYNRLECVVCLSPFEEDEDVRVLPRCRHAFHAACIDSWLHVHGTCPLCRVQISSLDVEDDAEPAAASMS